MADANNEVHQAHRLLEKHCNRLLRSTHSRFARDIEDLLKIIEDVPNLSAIAKQLKTFPFDFNLWAAGLKDQGLVFPDNDRDKAAMSLKIFRSCTKRDSVWDIMVIIKEHSRRNINVWDIITTVDRETSDVDKLTRQFLNLFSMPLYMYFYEHLRLEELKHPATVPGRTLDTQLNPQLSSSHQQGFYLDFLSLHPEITRRCQPLFEIEEYDNAILNAFKVIESEIRRLIKGNPSDIGVNLVTKAMSPKEPHIIIGSIDGEQEAAHQLYRGAIGLFKNPQSHRFLDTNDPVKTFEILSFASLLLRILDDTRGGTGATQWGQNGVLANVLKPYDRERKLSEVWPLFKDYLSARSYSSIAREFNISPFDHHQRNQSEMWTFGQFCIELQKEQGGRILSVRNVGSKLIIEMREVILGVKTEIEERES